jgi:hypothetical protein
MFDLSKDVSFDIQKTKDYILSIQVSLDGFSFLIVHPDEKRIVAFKNTSVLISSENLLARRIKEWIEEEALLKSQFKSVNVFIASEHFQLIPQSFYEQEYRRNITSTLFDKKVHNHFLEDTIESINAKLLYPVSQDVTGVLKQSLGEDIQIIHPVAHILKKARDLEKINRAFVLPQNKFFYLLVFYNNSVVLANSFPSLHPNDMVFHIVNSFQQLEADRNNTEIYLSGSTNQNNEIRSLLRSYFVLIRNLNISDFVSNPGIVTNTFPLYLTII